MTTTREGLAVEHRASPNDIRTPQALKAL